jgi:hypothetical protein
MTFAPMITAPLASSILPLSVAEVTLCWAATAPKDTNTNTSASRKMWIFIEVLLRGSKPDVPKSFGF